MPAGRGSGHPGPAERARGALWGLAVGDALGMPTQGLSRAAVRRRYGVLEGFHPGPPENEISAGLPAGRVTDDTDQAVIVAELLIAGRGRVDPAALAARLLAWQEAMAAAGSLDLLGPSTLRALADIAAHGPSPAAGRWGDTDGAAMRIPPVGIAVPGPVEALVEAVVAVSAPTHNTHVALAGACAVAAAVSSAIDGAELSDVLVAATQAARLGAAHGYYTPAPDLAVRLGWAVETVRRAVRDAGGDGGAGPGDPLVAGLTVIDELIGTSMVTQEAVPAAFAVLALAAELTPGGAADPWLVGRLGASLGGDADTVAAMAAAVAGALGGVDALPAPVRAELAAANPGLALDTLAAGLLALREDRPWAG